MSTAHAIAITVATTAFSLLPVAAVSALEIPEPGSEPVTTTVTEGTTCSTGTSTGAGGGPRVTAPVPYGFMGRPGW